MTAIAPFVWYESGAEDAAAFYAATFPNSSVDAVYRAPLDTPGSALGAVMIVEFTVLGLACVGLNGGLGMQQTQAFSFQVYPETQEETDLYWNAIVGHGGAENACGWCRDRWGVSWQITPRALMRAIADSDVAAAKRAMEAMMTMQRIDIAAIESAARGDPA